MKTTDFDANKKYTFIIPMGATEQHGPFLPLGTDSFLADKIIQEVENIFPEMIFLPTIRVTCSEEHAGFLGSIWLTSETMARVLFDLCHSLSVYAKTIALTSFHGGNLVLLEKFITEHAKTFPGVQLVHLPMGTGSAEIKIQDLLGGTIDAHAGNAEISMMLAYDESMAQIPPADYPKRVIEHAFRTNHLKDFSEDGIADNHPKWIVSRENGRCMTEWIVQDFLDELRKIL